MVCAACSGRVQRAVESLEGVSSCSVDPVTGLMIVEGPVRDGEVAAAVREAGYGLAGEIRDPEAFIRTGISQAAVLRRRFFLSLACMIPVVVLGMGEMFSSWGGSASMLIQTLCTLAIFLINGRLILRGFRQLVGLRPDMDSLAATGSSASFLWSLADFVLELGDGAAGHDGGDMYFESAAVILTLIAFGRMLESGAKLRSLKAVSELLTMAPVTAVVERGGVEKEIPASELKEGDVFIVRPGARIPADGVVLDGSGSVDESALTGESMPAECGPGSHVAAAAVDLSGFLRCRALGVGADTEFARMISLVRESAAVRAPVSRMADRMAGIFVPTVMVLSLITLAVWLILGAGFGTALGYAVAVLIVSCPCALGLATPMAVMAGSAAGARSGILFKNAAALEAAGRIRTVALDKTGTVTRGRPEVTGIYPGAGCDPSLLIRTACALESCSDHPLARAVTAWCREHGYDTGSRAVNATEHPGMGISGTLEDVSAACGSRALLISLNVVIPSETERLAGELASEGRTLLYCARGGQLLGMIALADTIREDSAECVATLHHDGLQTVLITGDNEPTARAIARIAGIHSVRARISPSGKADVIRELKMKAPVAMMGDGINDAPALVAADVGIAVRSGTDIAMDTADVILMRDAVSDLPEVFRLGRAVLRNIRQNLFWAFCYNTAGIPLAAGVFVPWGWHLSPVFAAAAMSLSSFSVIMNALRLRSFRRRNAQAGKCSCGGRSEGAGFGSGSATEKAGTGQMHDAVSVAGMGTGAGGGSGAGGAAGKGKGNGTDGRSEDGAGAGNGDGSVSGKVSSGAEAASGLGGSAARADGAGADSAAGAVTGPGMVTGCDPACGNGGTPDAAGGHGASSGGSGAGQELSSSGTAGEVLAAGAGVKMNKVNELHDGHAAQSGGQGTMSVTEKMNCRLIHIEGMKCFHCEKAVRKALEQIDGVAAVQISLDDGTASVEVRQDLGDDVLRKAVEAEDFTVTGIDHS